jgi:amino acid transporter
MAKKLERDLRLPEVLAISIGAMVGSGIFILPALAMQVSGPAVVLAYVLAAVLVVPAALSKSELATAMPEAGGAYIFVERGMGPLLGTICGIGTWFTMTFKSALALVGGVPYIILYFDLPIKPLALGVAAALILLNMFGTKKTGQFQLWLIVAMLIALGWLLIGGVPEVESHRFAGFFDKGPMGLLEATGVVFVSYAGVTQIVSVAEEIDNPERNIPLGMIGSLAFTTSLYVLMVIVMVGVEAPEVISQSLTPMADAADATLGPVGVMAVVAAAILALVSTANAGVLSASRYPLAMARDRLFPDGLNAVNERFGTPVRAITLTGTILLFLIAFVPLMEIAKLASAFLIVVFIFANLSVIAFRTGESTYDPAFKSPLYPWMQIFGVVVGCVVLTQMGTIPLIGAVVTTVGGAAWYWYWGRSRAKGEGLVAESIRRSIGQKVVEESKQLLDAEDKFRALVALREGTDMGQERDLLLLGDAVTTRHGGELYIAQFDQVADQVALRAAVDRLTVTDRLFEHQTEALERELDIEAIHGEVAVHDVKKGVVNFARHKGIEVIMLPAGPHTLRDMLPARDVEWILRNASADVMLVDVADLDKVEEIAVFTSRGAYEPAKIDLADAIAEKLGVPMRLVYPLRPNTVETKRASLEEYHRELMEACRCEVTSQFVDVVNVYEDIVPAFKPTDLAVIGLEAVSLKHLIVSRPEAKLVKNLPCSTIEYLPLRPRKTNAIEQFLERWVF